MAQDLLAELPIDLVSHVRSGCGPAGDQWLNALSSIILRLEEKWGIKVKKPFPGIEYNYVAPAVRETGEAVVIKIAPPWNPVEIDGEAAYLLHKNGIGCVKLLEQDRDERAILIDQIFPGRSLTEHFSEREPEAVAPAIDALQTVLGPVPADQNNVTPVDDWFNGLRNYAGTGFPTEYARKALEIYERLSTQPGCTYYLHGDYHPGNIVTQGDSSFCVIDPKGWLGHIGYEIAVFLNNFHWWQESKPEILDRLDVAVQQFSIPFDISPFELRQWAYAQMVIGAWWNFSDMPGLYDGSVVKADIWDV